MLQRLFAIYLTRAVRPHGRKPINFRLGQTARTLEESPSVIFPPPPSLGHIANRAVWERPPA